MTTNFNINPQDLGLNERLVIQNLNGRVEVIKEMLLSEEEQHELEQVKQATSFSKIIFYLFLLGCLFLWLISGLPQS